MRLTVLAACVMLAWTALAQDLCSTSVMIRFKPSTDPSGTVSFVVAENQPVFYTLGVALPPIVVQLLRDVATSSTAHYAFDYDGLVLTATTSSGAKLSADSVQVSRGEALFDKLTVTATPQPGEVLTFAFSSPLLGALRLRTGLLSAVTGASGPARVQFGAAGYFTRSGQTRSIPVNTPLPPFSLTVVDAAGHAVDESITITLGVLGATASMTTVPPGVVDGLALSLAPSSTVVRLTFTASARNGSWSSSVSTGPLTPVTAPLRNRFMLFDRASSSITMENQGGTAVLGVPLRPVVINLYTSAMELDTSNTGLIITATTPQGTLSGAEALVVRGVAQFAELTFVGVAPRSAVITFTAVAVDATASALLDPVGVVGASLFSGPIAVSAAAVKAKYLSFASASQVQTAALTLPMTSQEFDVASIIVLVRDSAGAVDNTASGIKLAVDIPPPGSAFAADQAKLEATVTNGIAVFTGMTFTLAASPIQFRVSDPSATASSGRTELLSGIITVQENPFLDSRTTVTAGAATLASCRTVSSSCPLTLTFAAEWGPYSSFVFAAEQPFAASVGSTIPTIVVELRDEFGVSTLFPASVAPQLVAYTADDPAAEQLLVTKDGANRGVYQKGRYYFSCLQFASAPAGLVRIQFMPVDESGTPAIRLEGITRGAPLRTGFATVTSVPTPAYGLRFAADVSVIAYAGQASSAVLNVALPAVTVEVTDSRGELDTTDSTTVIVASVSAGQLDATGARERVTRGRATFHGLKFSSMVDEPLLAFRAYQSARALAGRSLSTGRFMLTTLPVAEFNLGFLPQLTAESQVTHAFKSFIFQNLTDAVVRASIVVLDSAHQRATAVTSTIYISPSSEQVNLDSSELKSIDSRSACACANFSNRITGYKDGYQPGTPIYVTYTAVDASGLLRGKTVVAGPIVVGSLLAGATTCAANLVAPVVVAEFRMTVAQFRAANVRSQLAYLMGIELGRVTVQDASLTSITRVDHSTLATWVGSKAAIVFGDPLPASTNQKTSAQLAADFVGLRPRCDAKGLSLEAAYYQQDDSSCVPAAFRAAAVTSAHCVASGAEDTCRCYATGVVAQWGDVCVEEPTLKVEFTALCNTLRNCAEAEIRSVCTSVLGTTESTLLWLWILLGCLGGVLVLGVVAKQRGMLQRRPASTLTRGAAPQRSAKDP
jgi:hypothetical protein